MGGWMEDRKEGTYEITLEWNTTSAVESFLDGSCHACRCSRRFAELSCIHTYVEGRGYIHPP